METKNVQDAEQAKKDAFIKAVLELVDKCSEVSALVYDSGFNICDDKEFRDFFQQVGMIDAASVELQQTLEECNSWV